MATLNKRLTDLLNSDMEDVVNVAMQNSDFSDTNEAMVNYMENLLLPRLPNVNVYTLGSREFGVATESSFLDVYIDTDDSYETLGLDKNIAKRITKVQQLLFRSNQWKDIQVIDATVPFIQAYHKRLQIDCNLTVSDGLSHRDSELLKFFCEYQPILRDMIVLLKIWLKRAELSDYITNYTLTLLIINFLQHKRILPSIKALQAGISQPDRIGPWNVDFDRANIDCLNLDAPDDLESLTMDFFKFFSTAEKFDHVICPYLGVLAPKSYFTQKYVKSFKSYYAFATKYKCEGFTFAPMNVQALFNLADNTAKRVTVKQLRRFVDLCGESYSFLANETDDEDSDCNYDSDYIFE